MKHLINEIDFLTSKEGKINPIEVKSGNYHSHSSLDMFSEKYSNRIKDKYVIHTKDYEWKNGIHYYLFIWFHLYNKNRGPLI